MDYEVQRSARRCTASGRELAPGEKFYSVLMVEGAELRRYDYAVEAWQGAPPGEVGWWQSQLPAAGAKRTHGAPNDVLLQFFDELADQPDKQDMRYVLAPCCWCVGGCFGWRKRIAIRPAANGWCCIARGATPRMKSPSSFPISASVDEIQQELARLLE